MTGVTIFAVGLLGPGDSNGRRIAFGLLASGPLVGIVAVSRLRRRPEALHMARIHPQAASDSVRRKQAGHLHEAIRAVLAEGIRRNGASIDWVYRGGEYQNYFRVYDREGKPCPVCGTKIERLVVGQRGTHVCPKCQKQR